MKIVHFSKYADRGGAAIAALNGVRAQRRAGVDACLVIGRGEGTEPFIMAPQGLAKAKALLDFAVERLPFRLSGLPSWDVRSLGLAGIDAPAVAAAAGADIVVLHNIDGLVRLADLPRFGCPIVWRTHDAWAMCGVEHLPMDITPFRAGDLSAAGSLLSRWTCARKARAYAGTPDLVLCPPSRWLAQELTASRLLGDRRIETIPNGVDVEVFRPAARSDARARLGLPADLPLLLFGAPGGATNPLKGFDLLVEAIESAAPALREMSVRLVTFGGGPVRELPLPVHAFGSVTDRDKLALIYASAELTVVPSRQENLSLTVLESLACGTPVAAFDVGGMTDMVRPGQTGWLVKRFDPVELGGRLVDGLRESRSNRELAHRCREVVEAEFTLEVEARSMLNLFGEIMSAHGGKKK